MARLPPSDISNLALAGAREPELETLRQLQARLPSADTVFQGIHWSREYKSDIKFDELDFVVVNQRARSRQVSGVGYSTVHDQEEGLRDPRGRGVGCDQAAPGVKALGQCGP